MKYLVSAFLAFSVLLGFAVAGDCINPGTEPLEPQDISFIHNSPTMVACCCYSNDISVSRYEERIMDEDDCCGFYTANCDTWEIDIWRKATPTATEGIWNKKVNGQWIYSTVPAYTSSQLCICGGGASTVCYTAPVGTLYIFECEDCDE